MSKSLSFTGHRPQKLTGWNWDSPWKNEAVSRISGFLMPVLRRAIENGYTEFYSGGAIGFDQIAFWCVHKLKVEEGMNVRNIVAIPYDDQPNVWKNDELKAWYKAMLERADVVVPVDCVAGYVVKDVPAGKHSNLKLDLRNHYMVDQTIDTIALWNGTTGGTHNCIVYAQEHDHNILVIHPTTGKQEWI